MRLCVLCSIALALLPICVVGQNSKPNTPEHEKQGQSTTDAKNPVSQVVVQAHRIHEATDKQQPSSDSPQQSLNPELASAVFTGLIFIATTAYAVISYLTLKKIGRQAEITEAQQRQMIRQEEYSRLQWHAMHEQASTMAGQLEEMKKQTVIAAQQTSALGEQVKLIVAKERARLFVKLISESIPEPDLLNPSVTIEISHEGFASAFNVIGEGVVTITDTREFPQGISRYDIICATDDFSIRSLPSVIRPNGTPIRAIVTMRDDLSDADRDRIDEERAFLHVVGSVDYRDFLDIRCTEPFWYIWAVDSEEYEGADSDGPPEFVDLSRWEPRTPPADFGK